MEMEKKPIQTPDGSPRRVDPLPWRRRRPKTKGRDEDACERGIASIVGGQALCSALAEGAEAPSAREAVRGEGASELRRGG